MVAVTGKHRSCPLSLHRGTIPKNTHSKTRMKAGFLRRVSSGRDAQLHFYALPKDEEASDASPVVPKPPSGNLRQSPPPPPREGRVMAVVTPQQQPVKQPFRTTRQPKNKRRGLWQRFSRSKKKATRETPKALHRQESPPFKKHDDNRLQRQIFSPSTVSETASDAEVTTLPVTTQTSSCSVTTQTMEISDFSGSAAEQIRQQRTIPLKRAASDRMMIASRPKMVLNTSAMTRSATLQSAKLARRTGNESVGEAKPNQPRRGFLPPLLDADDESSCSGITMDFTYEDDIKSPVRQLLLQPIGRLGEGAVPSPASNSFIPPVYITMTESQDMELDLGLWS